MTPRRIFNHGAASLVAALAGLLAVASPPPGVVHIDLAPSTNAVAASLDYLPTGAGGRLRGILVLVPGGDGHGVDMLGERPWADFARFHGFILCTLTFASKAGGDADEGACYDALAGSGETASIALRRLGAGRVPVFMYGFSGGARFTVGFAEHCPGVLKGWCAASLKANDDGVRLNDEVSAENCPPGIVACGSEDPCYKASRSYYEKGRAAGRKWTWIDLDGLNHERSPKLEDFARRYFATLHHKKSFPDVWMDVGGAVDAARSSVSNATLHAWLPGDDLVEDWRRLNEPKREGVIERTVKLKLKDRDRLSVFLRLPPSSPPSGVLCLCLPVDSPAEVRECLRTGDAGRCAKLMRFAVARNLAVVAWDSKCLWDPWRSWDELARAEAKRVDSDFDVVARAWDSAIDHFVGKYKLPASGFLMHGASGAAQFAQRLAMRRPARFLAVHTQMPVGFDVPAKEGASLLWCVTIGENDADYSSSRRFFRAARGLRYPMIYKAYPDIGHEDCAYASELGIACFDYALKQQAHAYLVSGGKSSAPDWADIFSSAPHVADIFNQCVHSKFDHLSVPLEFRMLVPEPLREAWLRE